LAFSKQCLAVALVCERIDSFIIFVSIIDIEIGGIRGNVSARWFPQADCLWETDIILVPTLALFGRVASYVSVSYHTSYR